jgi:glycosyltransferase involved in cell wall biosynthesis
MVEIRSTKIIAISDAVKDFLLQRGEIARSVKVEVVHYGYNRFFAEVRPREKMDRTNIKWGTISRLTAQKDIPTMLGAFSKFREIAPGSTLSILGAGPLEAQLNELTKTMNLEQSVEFLGRSSRIYDFLADLDVFILTSRYEGFGMVLLEAMDAGIPIVASGNSAIPEVLGADFPGLCTTGDSDDFFQKIDRLSNPTHRKKVLELQTIQLAIFRADLMSQKISEIYEL